MNSSEINIFKHNKEMFISHLDIDLGDITTLDISISELIDAGIGKIKEISFEESNAYNWVMLITIDEGQVFYLELSEHGSIALLKKDGHDGEELLSFACDVLM
jgi:hypothetical protein